MVAGPMRWYGNTEIGPVERRPFLGCKSKGIDRCVLKRRESAIYTGKLLRLSAVYCSHLGCLTATLTNVHSRRYYKPWKDAQNSLVDVKEDERGDNAWGLTYEGYRPKASGDKALTAFAQLAALRLKVRRSMISLIDSTQQYILTEATRTLSLLSDHRHMPGDEVWLGNTIIKRGDAVCHHSFKSKYTATDDDGRTYTTEALVVPDMRLDDRFKDRDYVVRKPGVLFYAGVPIKTKAGHRIGVYAVSHEEPRFGLSIDELIFMEDVAATIMEHLELAKDRDALMNGSRMVRGLADFIEGIPVGDEPEIVNTSTSAMPINTSLEDQKASPIVSAVMRKQTQNAKKMLEDLDEMTASASTDDKPTEPPSPKESPKPSNKKSSEDDPNKILQRATHIIRKSTGADGVIFFNTSSRTFQGLGRQPTTDHADASSGITSGSDRQSDSTLPRRPRNRRMDSGDSVDDLRGKRRYPTCEVMGLSITQHEQYGRLEAKDFLFPEDNMERYLKNFPHGKFFSFTDTGSGISSGDELSAEDKPQPAVVDPGLDPTPARNDKTGRAKKERFIPSELLKVLPGIRSLIFLPLWDFTEGKYLAGGFIWTSTAGRLMNPDNELPYLKAFGNSIMSEISRAKAQKSDLAKTTFIASISHELRSPLHGILGSVEFLHETAVSAYQAGLFTSIETCGKTLLDTIDHVLDYAKINKLRKGNSTRKRGHYSKSGHRRETVGSIIGLTADFDLAALVEEVVDAVTAGHAFRRTHHGTLHDHQASGGGLAIATGADASLGLGTPPLPDVDPVVILDIKRRPSWFVRTQPGALRRIVMNLLGNALKYTDAGFVGVSLQIESETEQNTRVRLRFVDSGKGMSLEFQRTRLFSPFSQEDPFASGTGLGLSIVRQIVDALEGTISVSSTQNLGTEVDVVLTLPTVEKVPEHGPFDMDFAKNARICIVDPYDLASEAGIEPRESDHRGLDHLRDTLRNNCEEWFGIEIEHWSRESLDAQQSPSNAPACDYMLFPLPPTSADMLLKWHGNAGISKGPTKVIVICSNTAEASDFRSNISGPLLEKGIQAVPVTQPLGPRKFANVLQKFRNEQVAQDISLAIAEQKQRIVIGRQDSDPEAIRREREMLFEAEKARIAEAEAIKEQESSDSQPAGENEYPQRPGPGVLVNGDGEAERGNEGSSESLAPLISAAAARNLTLGRSRAVSASRSMSAPPDRPLSQHGAAKAADSAAARPHVLLVDDNDINLQLLVMFMKKQNLSYATASNGLIALEQYESACGVSASPSPPTGASGSTNTTAARYPNGVPARPPFTHILMDISMPVMDGLTSTRKIRALEVERAVKPPATIIALTGLASAEAQDDAISAGINKFLVKPVKFGELKGLLKEGSG
ncbi:hypothetical protein N8I77_000166 [Diaporthe amygdali]|uniref:histidine kinase n=1 Tax=Phomopsis amygdali TaxID=1214568 RepID=A0AAD9SP17_PHOAM|nr:hypothetical protein N8I77_000166 [Diaporthe amygdali]